MPVSPESLIVAAAIVAGGYFVFGLSGFGSSLLTVPVLSHFWPMPFVLPVLAMLDLTAALILGVRHRAQAQRTELVRMIPLAFIGAVIGVSLLVNMPRSAALAALGTFVALYGVYALFRRGTPAPVSRHWAYLAGVTGGASGAMFGIGGPAYVIYLSRRLTDKGVLRATLASLVIFSVGSRLALFAFAGLVRRDTLTVVLVLLPFAFAGLWTGGRVHVRISPDRFGRFISAVLVAMGASLLAHAFAG